MSLANFRSAILGFPRDSIEGLGKAGFGGILGNLPWPLLPLFKAAGQTGLKTTRVAAKLWQFNSWTLTFLVVHCKILIVQY